MRVVFVVLYDEFALGARSLSSFLKARGHEAYRILLKTLVELDFWPQISEREGAAEVGPRGFFAHPCRVTTREMDFLFNTIADLRPDLVGIPLTSNLTHIGEFLTRCIRAELGLPVIWGGIDPTLHPEKAIEFADFVCIGEGEYAVADLLDAMAGGRREPTIDGIWTRRGDGSVSRGAMRPLIQDLDALPYFDWDPDTEFYIIADETGPGFMPPHHTNVHYEVPVMTQRGCPFACSYCCSSLIKTRYPGQRYMRRRSVENVIGELHSLRRRFPEVQRFLFHDDLFTVNPKWIDAFCEAYSREIGLPFWVFTHPLCCTRRMLEPLKKAGLAEARMGIQSGSGRVLRQCYNRRGSPEQILQAARLIRDLGLDLTIDLIACNPMETEEDHRATMDLLFRLPRPFRISAVNPLCFFDGLPVTEKALRAGVPLSYAPGGERKYEQPVSAEMRFWAALMGLTMFDLDPETILRPLMEDPYLREHPEILEKMWWSLYPMSYVNGRGADVPKDRYIAHLESDLAWWHERSRRPLLRKMLDKLLRR